MDINDKKETLDNLEIISKLLDIKLKIGELKRTNLIAEKDRAAIENIEANSSFILREQEIAKENIEAVMLGERCCQM